MALIVCAVVTKLMTGDDPISIFKTIAHGAFGTGRTLVTIHDIAILLCISLAVTPAFRMKFWNTGAEGQVLIGCLSTAVCMLTLGGKVPDWLLIIIMAASAIVSGIIWGVIPAIFKAQWGTNETLFTLMMNYVAIQLVEYFFEGRRQERIKRCRTDASVTRLVPRSVRREISHQHNRGCTACCADVYISQLQQARI